MIADEVYGRVNFAIWATATKNQRNEPWADNSSIRHSRTRTITGGTDARTLMAIMKKIRRRTSARVRPVHDPDRQPHDPPPDYDMDLDDW